MTSRLTFEPTLSHGRAVIDVNGSKAKSSEALAQAAQALAGPAHGMAGKVAIKAAKMRLGSLLRRTGPLGHVLVWERSGDGGSEEAPILLADLHLAAEHTIQTAAEIKASLVNRIPTSTVQYLDHPALGIGGRTTGTTKELNEEVHVIYFAFIDRSRKYVMEFEVTRDAGDGSPFSSKEIEEVTEIIKGCSLVTGDVSAGPAPAEKDDAAQVA